MRCNERSPRHNSEVYNEGGGFLVYAEKIHMGVCALISNCSWGGGVVFGI